MSEHEWLDRLQDATDAMVAFAEKLDQLREELEKFTERLGGR